MGTAFSHEDADDILRPEELDELEALSGFVLFFFGQLLTRARARLQGSREERLSSCLGGSRCSIGTTRARLPRMT